MPTEEVQTAASVPFWYWGCVYFVFGAMFGSLANVCIYRMPRNESIVTPRSHCPGCGYMIPWFHNIPLVSWLQLQGRCANCGIKITPRYFLVELLTGLAFLSCWLGYGRTSPAVAAVLCVLLYGFIIATFIDFEHFIIPDEITLGGIVVGFLCATAVPDMVHVMKKIAIMDAGAPDSLSLVPTRAESMKNSFLGIVAGGGAIYAILRMGKVLFGRRNVELEPDSKLIFTETHLHLPNEAIPFEDIFYRKSDTVVLHAKRLEMTDRSYADADMALDPTKLRVGEDEFDPEQVHHMEITTDAVVLPREAMGFGDVKFMAAIGAFLGWQAVFFTLMLSSILGSVVGLTAMFLGRQNSTRIPYGPYIAVAAAVWVFFGAEVADGAFNILQSVVGQRQGPPAM